MTTVKPSAFVAYTERDSNLSHTVLTGVRKANSVAGCRIRYEPWEFNDISGKALISPIIYGIDASPFVVADITYLNLNVVYEIGFAIGRKKKVLLLRNSQIEGDRDIAKAVGIFDTIGYTSYVNEEDIRHHLTCYISEDPLQFGVSVNHKAPAYVLPNNGTCSKSFFSSLLETGPARHAACSKRVDDPGSFNTRVEVECPH